MAYAVGNSVVASEACGILRRKRKAADVRVLYGLVTSVAAAGNLVVVHTPSGAAQYVARVIDKQPIEGVLGTIAGDDTVMVICADDDSKQRAQWLFDCVQSLNSHIVDTTHRICINIQSFAYTDE